MPWPKIFSACLGAVPELVGRMLSSRTVAEARFLRRLPRRDRWRSNPECARPRAGAWDGRLRNFEEAAAAAAPFIADPSLKIGARIRRAVEASFAAAGCNTNLGILLLCAPLARRRETIDARHPARRRP